MFFSKCLSKHFPWKKAIFRNSFETDLTFPFSCCSSYVRRSFPTNPFSRNYWFLLSCIGSFVKDWVWSFRQLKIFRWRVFGENNRKPWGQVLLCRISLTQNPMFDIPNIAKHYKTKLCCIWSLRNFFFDFSQCFDHNFVRKIESLNKFLH